MSETEVAAPRRKSLRVLLSFAVGLVVGGAAASGVFFYTLNEQASRYQAERDAVAKRSTEVDHKPITEEVLDYLDGKPLPLPDGPVGGDKAGRTLVIRKADVSELRWNSATQQTGVENPWSHHYSFLCTSNGIHYVVDVTVEVRQVGGRRVFLGLNVRKVVPGDMVSGVGTR